MSDVTLKQADKITTLIMVNFNKRATSYTVLPAKIRQNILNANPSVHSEYSMKGEVHGHEYILFR